MRSDEHYHADILKTIRARDFYRPGDRLRLVRQYREARKCEMCGGIVDIEDCYDLQNDRTKKVIVCGNKCIDNYAAVVAAEWGQSVPIVFPPQYRAEADKVNNRRRNTVTIYDPNDPRHPLPNIDNDEELELRDRAREEGVDVDDLTYDEDDEDDDRRYPQYDDEDDS